MAKVDDWDIRYGLSHPIAITPGGPLATIAEAGRRGPRRRHDQFTLHAQAPSVPTGNRGGSG